MRVDLKALNWMWKQTVWATGIAFLFFLGLIAYILTRPTPDYDSVWLLIIFVMALPVMFGITYLIRRLIEYLAD